MRKNLTIFAAALAVVLVVGFVGVGVVLAEDPTPTPEYGPGWMMGQFSQEGGASFGRMGGRGMMSRFAEDDDSWGQMQAMHGWMSASGGMHTAVLETLTEKLGLTSDELYAQLQDGKTLAEVAEEKGVSRTDLLAALEKAHQDAAAQAVTDGVLTQEQADSMLANMAGRYEWMLDNMGAVGKPGATGKFGAGGPGFGGCHGGWNNNPDSSQPKP